TNCPLTDLGGKTSIFSHPVYLFLREFSLQDFRGGSVRAAAAALCQERTNICLKKLGTGQYQYQQL
ncbi:hypothetical protein, partial [Escherichia coli]